MAEPGPEITARMGEDELLRPAAGARLPRAIRVAPGLLALAVATNLAAAGFFAGVECLSSNRLLAAAGELLIANARVALFLVATTLGGTLAGLLFELSFLGWRTSSVRRLLEARTPSDRTDLFYLWLTLSGLRPVLSFALSLGAGHAVTGWIRENLGLSLLADWSPVPCFAAIVLAQSLAFYVVHRIMHTSAFWEIHKVHHTAEALNVVTPHRNHPLDHAIATAVNALPAAILGAPPGVLMAYVAVNAFYQQAVHSPLDWRPGWWDRIVIGPRAHRVHHSSSPDHWGHNYGILVLWDWLFGTWLPPERAGSVDRLGLPGEPLINRDSHIRDIWELYVRQARVWAVGLARLRAWSAGGAQGRAR
jgi:sterol desaturase/sphingolipid hydroxylase (fatty acid hydroxylase superfamily)